MMNETLFCTIFYFLMGFFVIYPPDEVISAGLTVESILSKWLGSEVMIFTMYHTRRTVANIVAHSLLLPGYLLLLYWVNPLIAANTGNSWPVSFEVIALLSLLPFGIICLVVLWWYLDSWKNHPFSKVLAFYAKHDKRNLYTSWQSVASEINIEIRRVDKLFCKLNNVSSIVATDSWFLKISPYSMKAIPLQQALFFLESSIDSEVTPSSSSPGQFVLVRVASIRSEVDPFYFKINSASLKELERKLVNPIINTKRIVIHGTLADRFQLAFEDAVNNNPKLDHLNDLDLCIGCMTVRANVKLQRRCKDGNPSSRCFSCSCNPMWCLSCLSKWFAARQDENAPQTWLSSTAPCPSCRSAFCVLDVCVIQNST